MNNNNNKQTNAHSRSLGPSQSRPRSKQHGSECLLTNGPGGHQLKVGARLDQERRDAAATGHGHPVHRAAHEAWSDKNGLSHGREHGIPLRLPTRDGSLNASDHLADRLRLPTRDGSLNVSDHLAVRHFQGTEFESALSQFFNSHGKESNCHQSNPPGTETSRSFQPQSFQSSRNTHLVKGGNQGMSKAQLRRASRALKVKSGTLHGNPHFHMCRNIHL
jgi:hypothetical protein